MGYFCHLVWTLYGSNNVLIAPIMLFATRQSASEDFEERMPNRPNLRYIHTDQHSFHVAGCYGDGLVQTPNLDRLAAFGALFANCYCASPICVPSRMSMLSARSPLPGRTCRTNGKGAL